MKTKVDKLCLTSRESVVQKKTDKTGKKTQRLRALCAVILASAVVWGVCNIAWAEEAELNTPQAQYMAVSGTITQINPLTGTGIEQLDGQSLVLVEGQDGEIMNFSISKETYMLTEDEPELGKTAIGFYKTGIPAIMIYPPQMPAVVFAVSPDETADIKVDLFDQNLVSVDNTLKLNVSEQTPVVSTDGTAYDGDIANKSLVVLYNMSTKSIPAQTSPLKIIVLPDEETHATENQEDTQEDIPAESGGIITVPGNESDGAQDSSLPVVVNGAELEGVYALTEGEVMVPFRAASEALGFEVGWEAASKSVTINGAKAFTAGSDYYYYFNQEQEPAGTQLTASRLVAGVTYVPVNYFTEVMNIGFAEVVNSKVIIGSDISLS